MMENACLIRYEKNSLLEVSTILRLKSGFIPLPVQIWNWNPFKGANLECLAVVWGLPCNFMFWIRLEGAEDVCLWQFHTGGQNRFTATGP